MVRSAELIGSLAPRFTPQKAEALASNVRRVLPDAEPEEIDRIVVAGFRSYGRYWAETLRLPTLSAAAVDAGFSVDGYEHLTATRDAGFGPIMVLPHLGGWEWAAAWLGKVAKIPVTAVVERLEPPEVFEWFADLRRSYGISVVPVGEGAMPALTRAVRDRHVVCLLGDRDVAGTGVPIEFFGEPARLPIGPAVLSRRTGAPIHPTAVFFDGSRTRCVIGEPLWPTADGRLRDEATATMGTVVGCLEEFIREAPDQWHVLEPIWDVSSPPALPQSARPD